MINIQRLIRVSKRIQLEVTKRSIYSQSINANKIKILSNDDREIPQVGTRSMALMQSKAIKNLLAMIPFLGVNKTKLKAIAYKQFEVLVDELDYIEFFEEFGLSDTFYSWFVVTELHLWMLSVRAMIEGDEGRLIRNTLVEALWADVLQRVKKLGTKSNPIDIRTKIVELSEQLQASYIAYDEGYLAEDVVLAGAVWRRFYQQKDVDVEQIEKLVKYIRKSMRTLEKLSADEFYDPKNIKWASVTT